MAGSIEPGQSLSNYHLIEKIREGGMGTVSNALGTSLYREVALKLVPWEMSGDPAALA
jgi:hypothetical protein